MSSPVNTQIVLLRPRIPVLVGTLVALNAPVQLGVCESLTPRGQFSISAYQSGLSAVTAVLECSIDQGVSWFSIPAHLDLLQYDDVHRRHCRHRGKSL